MPPPGPPAQHTVPLADRDWVVEETREGAIAVDAWDAYRDDGLGGLGALPLLDASHLRVRRDPLAPGGAVIVRLAAPGRYVGGRARFVCVASQRTGPRQTVVHDVALGAMFGVVRVPFVVDRGTVEAAEDGSVTLSFEQRYDLDTRGGRAAHATNWAHEIEDTAIVLSLWAAAL